MGKVENGNDNIIVQIKINYQCCVLFFLYLILFFSFDNDVYAIINIIMQ